MIFIKGFTYLLDLGGNHKQYEDVVYTSENLKDFIHEMMNKGYRYIGDMYTTKGTTTGMVFGKEVDNSETKMVIIDSFGT